MTSRARTGEPHQESFVNICSSEFLLGLQHKVEYFGSQTPVLPSSTHMSCYCLIWIMHICWCGTLSIAHYPPSWVTAHWPDAAVLLAPCQAAQPWPVTSAPSFASAVAHRAKPYTQLVWERRNMLCLGRTCNMRKLFNSLSTRIIHTMLLIQCHAPFCF